MEIKILAPEEVEFKEKDVQRAFEHDLPKLEEGLEFVDTEVTIGTGRIDTLAYDSDNRPVFIEYKAQGEFGKDALIQLWIILVGSPVMKTIWQSYKKPFASASPTWKISSQRSG